MAFTLPELPYDTSAFGDVCRPRRSSTTTASTTRPTSTRSTACSNPDEEGKSLEDIILSCEGKKFNQAAQIWNHNLYWESITPGGGGAPSGAAGDAVNEAFGSYDTFREEFKTAGHGPVRLRLGMAHARRRHARPSRRRQRRPADEARPDRRARRATCGSTPTTSTTATSGPTTSTRSSTASSTGSCSSRRCSATRRRRDAIRRRRAAGARAARVRRRSLRRTLGQPQPRQRLDHVPARVDLEPAVGRAWPTSARRGGCCAGPRRR